MEAQKLGNVDITDGIAVGEHEGLVSDIVLYTLYAAACLRIEPGIHDSHLPWLNVLIMDNHLIASGGIIKSNI